MNQKATLRCGGAPSAVGPRPAVVMWDLNARDAAKMREFYRRLFAWEVGAPSEDRVKLATVQCGEGGISGVIGQAPREDEDDFGLRHSGLIFYVKVDDVQEYLDQAERLGGRTIWGPFEAAPGLVLAQFEDPEGTRIGLST